MQEFSIPICYFPSTVLFIDDGHDFLLNCILHWDEGLAYRIFDAPQKALAYIRNKRCELELMSSQHWLGYTQTKYCPLTHQTMNVALAAMHAEIYNRNRFSEISVVVVVDDAMPLMDGLAFCSQIENSNIKKILLIDPSDEKLAIAACHEGVIDQYIKKNDRQVEKQIRKAIDTLQLAYFNIMSGMILRLLSLTPPSCLYDKAFAQFFLKLREENAIVEFYLVDNAGSFLLLDEDANVSFLIVKDAETLSSYRDLAEKSEIDAALLEPLYQGDKIPGFWQANAHSALSREGLTGLVPAKRFVSNKTYYYAYLKGNVLFDVCQQKISSFHHYLEELDAEVFLLG